MRKHARNWLMKVILGIIIVVFIFYFGSMRGQDKAETIAKIDGMQIARAEYIKEYENLLELYRQQYGDRLSERFFKTFDLKQQAYNNLMDRMVILAKANDLDIQVSDEEIKKSIVSYPAFQRNGTFDPVLYERILAYQKIAPEEFEEGQREFLKIRKLERLIKESVKVTDEEALDIYRMQNESINLEFIKINTDQFENGINPSEDDLKTFLKNKEENFRIPRQVKLEYIEVPAAGFMESFKISEEEIEEYYRYNKDEFAREAKTETKTDEEKKSSEKKEIAPLAEVKDTIQQKLQHIKGMEKAFAVAKEAHDTIYQEDNFQQYAREHSLKITATEFFSQNKVPEKLLTIDGLFTWAFDLKEGEISPVLSDDEAHYILRLIEDKPSYIPPLEEVRNEVEKEYRESESIKRSRMKAEEILDLLKKGSDFDAVAKQQGVTTGQTGLFKPGNDIPEIGFSTDIFGALYELSEKHPYPETPFLVDGNYVIVRFRERGNIDEEEWEKSKEELKNSLRNLKRENYFTSWLAETRETMIRNGRIEIVKDAENI
jgi:peptidyl-prolyl cis-trans isomerase D